MKYLIWLSLFFILGIGKPHKDSTVECFINGEPAGWGSYIDLKNGLYLTAGHVAEGVDELRIDNKSVDVLYKSEKEDWAILGSLTSRSMLRLGTPNTNDFYYYSFKGENYPMSFYSLEDYAPIYGQPVMPGMSGSGVYDRYGNLAGIITHKIFSPEWHTNPVGLVLIMDRDTIEAIKSEIEKISQS